MKLHANASSCPKSRRLLIVRVREQGWSVMAAAEAAGISERSAYRWLRRFREEGERGLLDRSSAPKRIPHKTPSERVKAIEALRRLRMTAAEISELLAIPISTVSAWLKRIGLGKRSRLEPPEPPNRYELGRPGLKADKAASSVAKHQSQTLRSSSSSPAPTRNSRKERPNSPTET
jgi:transposase